MSAPLQPKVKIMYEKIFTDLYLSCYWVGPWWAAVTMVNGRAHWKNLPCEWPAALGRHIRCLAQPPVMMACGVLDSRFPVSRICIENWKNWNLTRDEFIATPLSISGLCDLLWKSKKSGKICQIDKDRKFAVQSSVRYISRSEASDLGNFLEVAKILELP